VVAFHAGLPVPGGFMGVDVFFAISGFVITTMLLSELESSGGIDFPRFCLRRARRLLPALALMLSFVLSLGAVLSPAVTQRMTALTGMAAPLFVANAYLLNLDTGYFGLRRRVLRRPSLSDFAKRDDPLSRRRPLQRRRLADPDRSLLPRDRGPGALEG
jgi:peptidoglycan/LPS O-acetylase OafA/YrhL